MDPTQTLIDLISALEQFEESYEEDPKSDDTEMLRTEVIGHLNALTNWFGPLNGYPPEISEIDFEREADDD